MKLEDIKTGDYYLVKSKVIMSRAIQYFMRLYAKKWKIKYTEDDIYSHAGTFLWLNNTLYIAESVDNGFSLREFSRHYNIGNGRSAVYSPVVPYTKDEISSVIKNAIELTTVNVMYQIWNFVQWPLYIWTKGKVNLFPKRKNSRGTTYCFESTQRIKEVVRPQNYNDNPEITNIFMLSLDKNFKRVDNL